MSTQLPEHPNLEHLKKQAKALLEASRTQAASPLKLADAQRMIAREYGFESWKKLKDHVDESEFPEAVQQAKKALREDDAPALRRILKRYPALKKNINAPAGDFDSPLLHQVRSEAMLDVMLNAGADLNARSQWWAGGFGLLDTAKPELARHAIGRGALVTVHSASRLGMMDRLRELVEADPALVHARGGDGQTPLHFASTVEIAAYLLDHGADIDARDVDHESTPAQYMLRDRPEVARYLISRGAKADLLMAAALGDVELAKRLLLADPESIRTRVDHAWFPKTAWRSGGTIYQWVLGWHVSACQVAKAFNQDQVFQLLMEHCPPDEKLINACWIHDEPLVKAVLERNPDVVASLSPALRRQLPHAARNNDGVAARLMLQAGLPVNTGGQHHATVLHWAAWHGNTELVREILTRKPDIENVDNEYKSSPLGWTMHGSLNGWYLPAGDHPGTIEALLDAGAKIPEKISGSEAVLEVFRRRRRVP